MPDAQWNVNAEVFVPNAGRPPQPMGGGAPSGGAGMPAPGVPGGPMGPRPPMGPPFQGQGYPGVWPPQGVPGPNMASGMAGPGWPRMPMEAPWQQMPGGMPGPQGPQGAAPPAMYGGPMPGGMIGAGSPGQGMPPQAEAPDVAATPQSFVAVWNLEAETDEEGLRNELDEIDFLPDTFMKVQDLDGAFLLGYREFPFLSEALWVALDGTQGHLKDNGGPVCVARPTDDKDVPAEITRAFDELAAREYRQI